MTGLVVGATLGTLAGSLLLLVQVFWLAARGDNSAPLLPDAERKRHYVWGMFYMNPADPRGRVPKTWGYGWTVNFRSMTQVYVFVVLIVLTLASALATTAAAF